MASVTRYYCPEHGRVPVNDEERCAYCNRPTNTEEKEVD
jgi:uncharacterized OB-fold protein